MGRNLKILIDGGGFVVDSPPEIIDFNKPAEEAVCVTSLMVNEALKLGAGGLLYNAEGGPVPLICGGKYYFETSFFEPFDYCINVITGGKQAL